MIITRTRAGYMSLLMLLVALASGCGGKGTLSPYYKFPIIPIKVAYDVLSRKLSVSISGEIQTPLGSFGLSTGVDLSQEKFKGVRTLTIQSGGRSYVYQLEGGKRYSINLPSDENGQTQILYSGEDDNLSIVIPNPTTETVAGLREQLKAAQETHGQDSAEAESDEAKEVQDTAGNTNFVVPSNDEIKAQQAQEADAQRQRDLQWQAREEELQRGLDAERLKRVAAEDREQQALRAEQEVRQQHQEAEIQRRDDEANQRRQEQERKKRRNEKLLEMGIEVTRDILRRHRN